MTRKTGAPLPGPRPRHEERTPEEEVEYRASVAAYHARIETLREFLRILRRGHATCPNQQPTATGPVCTCIRVPLAGYGATELSAAWQEFACEGEERLPGAIAHHTPESEAAARALEGQVIQFGLRAQGHLPVIESMLAAGASWVAIGDAIGWDPATAKEHYEREARKNPDLGEDFL